MSEQVTRYTDPVTKRTLASLAETVAGWEYKIGVAWPEDERPSSAMARAAATIEALHARVAELSAVPSSPDTDEVTGPPDRIYLCYGDICELDLPVSHVDCEEVTWSDHPPCDVVVEYVRSAAMNAALARIAASRAECERLREAAGKAVDAFWGSDYVAKLRAMEALRGALGDGQ
ncbi:MAG: hypothetical protein MOGMAGMI_02462 [Candidatus Omnitrophica bacterium]|nr:hypothetical protein [Candidatus Omnitrophota bacterium]